MKPFKVITTFVQNHLAFLLGLILTVILLWPLIYAPYFSHHDDVQTIRLYEMDKCIKDMQIPCRWVPDLGGEYGYPLFNYYGPLPYYIGELVYLLTNDILASAKFMFGFAFIGAYCFMYLLGKKLWGNWGGMVSGVFYSYAPYHAATFYVRGAMGELWGLMFFPAIIWSLLNLQEKPTLRNMAIFGSLLAFLLTSHNLSTMMFLPVILIYLALAFIRSYSKRFLQLSVAGILLAVMLASFYFLPMIVERNLAHVETTTYGYFYYTEHFKGLRKLFIERMWDWGSSVREVPGGLKDSMSFQIGWVHLFIWMISMALAIKYWKTDRHVSIFIFTTSAIAVGAIFLIHPRSQFIWDMIPAMKFFQFPWRFLMLIIFTTSLLSGSIVKLKILPLKVGVFIAITLVVLLNVNYFRPREFYFYTQAELFTGQSWDKLIKRSIFDFLPIYAVEPPAELATSRFEVVTGDTKISNFSEGTNWINFEADTQSHSIIKLSQYYFPNWIIKVDGEEVNVEYENNHLGLMNFILGKGRHVVEARLYDTNIRKLGNTLTVVGFSIILFILIVQIGVVRKYLEYYMKALFR